MSKRLQVVLWASYADGTPSELLTIDLVGWRGRARKLQLGSLDADLVVDATPVPGWRRGSEGVWISFPMGSDTVFGQWREVERGVGQLRQFRLKVFRILSRDEREEYLDSVPEAE